MIKIDEIIGAVTRKHGGIVTKIMDYNDEWYVVECLKDLKQIDYSDPFYAVNKKTLGVVYFLPSYDIDNFIDAAENRVLYEFRNKKG